MKEHSEKLLERKETAGHSEIHQSPARSCALAPMLRREILRGRTITFARGVTMLAQAALLLSSLTAPINHEPQVSAKSHHGRWSWSAVEITLGGMFVATLWVDRKQTRAATEAGVRESSPIIGPHPSAGQIDTYAALYSLAHLANPRRELFHFFGFLRSLDATCFLISEVPTGDGGKISSFDEEFLSDGILYLRLFEKGETDVQLRLRCVKMRRAHHEHGYYALIRNNGRFQITRAISE